MSLTGILRGTGSIKSFLETLVPDVYAAVGNNPLAKKARDRLGFYETAQAPTYVSRPEGMDGVGATLAGTAFDYRARMMLEPTFDVDETIALAGLELLEGTVPGSHEAFVFGGVFSSCRALLESGSAEDLDLASIGLAWLEQIYRAGVSDFCMSQVAVRARQAFNGAQLLRSADELVLKDIANLRILGGGPQIETWQDSISAGGVLVSNPMFAGAYLVGGADGDWILDGMLIDCKVVQDVTVSKLRGYLLQLLGYVMLDLTGSLGITSVGIWFPRQSKLVAWSLADLLGSEAEISRLKAEFLRIAKQSTSAVALVDTKLQDKMELLMATNLHTPFEILDSYALTGRESVRRNIAANLSTPVATLVCLAGDGRATVRKAVALNPNTPEEVRVRLTSDKTAMVREAALGDGFSEDRRLVTRVRSSFHKPDQLGQDRLLGTGLGVRNRQSFLDRDEGYGWRLWSFFNDRPVTIEDYVFTLGLVHSYEASVFMFWSNVEKVVRKSDYTKPQTEFDSSKVDYKLQFISEFYPQEYDAEVERRRIFEEERTQRALDAVDLEGLPLDIGLIPTARSMALAALRGAKSSSDKAVLVEAASHSSDKLVRSVVASYTDDVSLLVRMMWDPRLDVRERVIENILTPEEVLSYLAGDRSIAVRRMAAMSTRISGETLDVMLRNNKDYEILLHIANNPQTSAISLRELACSPQSEVRGGVAMNMGTPDDLLRTLALDSDLLVVLKLCLNPNLPFDLLETLAKDRESCVAGLASTALAARRRYEVVRGESEKLDQKSIVHRS